MTKPRITADLVGGVAKGDAKPVEPAPLPAAKTSDQQYANFWLTKDEHRRAKMACVATGKTFQVLAREATLAELKRLGF